MLIKQTGSAVNYFSKITLYARAVIEFIARSSIRHLHQLTYRTKQKLFRYPEVLYRGEVSNTFSLYSAINMTRSN